MNKEHYFNQQRLQQLELQEMERKWRVMQEQRLWEASLASGGAGNENAYLGDYVDDYIEP